MLLVYLVSSAFLAYTTFHTPLYHTPLSTMSVHGATPPSLSEAVTLALTYHKQGQIDDALQQYGISIAVHPVLPIPPHSPLYPHILTLEYALPMIAVSALPEDSNEPVPKDRATKASLHGNAGALYMMKGM